MSSERMKPGVIEKRDRLRKQSLTLSTFLCLFAAVFPFVAAMGWILHLEQLIRIHRSLPAMQPNTAFALVLCAIAIAFTREDHTSKKTRVMTCALATAVSLLGILTLGEYLFSWNLAIDRVFASGAAM